ncbi:MAG TPA: glycosyl hydrolase family 28 protein, partial [Terriglobia bacterium]|nr:glycosyl hydrolase family 28 protein [Terriglobia bacterium]
VRIYNRVNRNNDGFHFVSCENVHVSNCDVQCQDDACAMFGSCRKITVTNSSFSTRWSVFRLGGGDPSDITISNCVIYETYGCPIKMTFGPESRAENILFSNIVMDDVTGPISIGLGKKTVTAGFDRADVTGPVSKSLAEDSRQEAAPNKPSRRGYVRNITFNGLRARVIANGRQFPDIPFVQDYRSGETRQCIALNCITDSFIEGITFQDVHVTYAGGGTLQEANRTIPAVVGEYYERGTPPAYGLYARRVRGLTLNNVRFETELPDLRPAVVFDHVADAALTGLSAQGNKKAMALLRFFYASDVLVTAARVLSPAAVFLRVEGYSSRNIVVDGGDLSKAATVSELKGGAKIDTVKLRA